MIDKSEIEKIIRIDLLKVLATDTFYHYTKYHIAIDDILFKQTLQFSNPKTFNDPFDCNEKLLKINYDEVILNTTISNLNLKLSRQDKRELKRRFKNPKTQIEIFENERKKFKIACFSEFYDEILMWSYYADKHSGICIGFNFPHKYDEKFIMCPVKYLDELTPLDGQSNALKAILYWLTTKSISWRHEQEIRAITKSKKADDYEFIHFETKYIKEIIFGCNVSDEKLKDAIQKLKTSNLDLESIAIKRMRIDESSFLLKAEVIKK